MKFMIAIFSVILAFLLGSSLGAKIQSPGSKVDDPSPSNTAKPNPGTRCLMSNEVDPQSSIGAHFTVKILEETKEWYVTGWAWDNLVHEWVELDYKVIDKARAPQYVTLVDCPSVYDPHPGIINEPSGPGENEQTLYQDEKSNDDATNALISGMDKTEAIKRGER